MITNGHTCLFCGAILPKATGYPSLRARVCETCLRHIKEEESRLGGGEVYSSSA